MIIIQNVTCIATNITIILLKKKKEKKIKKKKRNSAVVETQVVRGKLIGSLYKCMLHSVNI